MNNTDNETVNIEFSGAYGPGSFYKKYGSENIRNFNTKKLQNQSLVLTGQGIKYSGTVINKTNIFLFSNNNTRGNNSRYSIWRKFMVGRICSLEFYGNYRLDQKQKIFQGLMMKGTIKGGGNIWGNYKK